MDVENEIESLCLLCDESRYDEALAQCDRVLSSCSDERFKAVFTYNKGLIYERMADYSNAVRLYKKSSVYGQSITPLKRVYEISLYNNDLNSAYSSVEEMIKIEPDMYYPYDLKMNFLTSIGNSEELSKTIKVVEEKFEESSLITLAKVKMLMISNQYEEALDVIGQRSNDDELKEDFLLLKSIILLSKADFGGAIIVLKQLYEQKSDNVDIIYFLGYSYLLNNQFESAADVLSNLEDIDYCTKRTYLMGLYLYGISLKYLNKESMAYFSDLDSKYVVYELNMPNDINIKLLRALVFNEIGSVDDALDEINRIERMNFDFPEVHFIKALIYKKAGNEQQYKENIEYLSKKSTVYYNLIKLMFEKGKENGEDIY